MREISIQKINRVCCGLSPVCNKICNYAPTINYTLVRCLQTLCATTHPTRAWNDAVWRCKTEAFLACPWNVNELPRTKWHVPTQNITTFSDDSSFLVSQTHAPLSLSLSAFAIPFVESVRNLCLEPNLLLQQCHSWTPNCPLSWRRHTKPCSKWPWS